MITAQIILILGFLLFLWRVIVNPASKRLNASVKILAILFVVVAVISILFPDITNKVAKLVGIGRGADLLLYLLTLSFVVTVFFSYIKEKRLIDQIAVLTRKIAIIEAKDRNTKTNNGK